MDALIRALVESVEGSALINGRFSSASLVNYSASDGRWRGCFSIVFRATDEISGAEVALKFFNPLQMLDVYRLNAFRREHEILSSLVGVERCVQLAAGLTSFQLQVTSPGGVIEIPCEYFALDWVEDEIDSYFLCQESHQPVEKLLLLSQIVSSVQMLHARGVFHRDLKHDNLRAMSKDGRRTVVPIDLGTAARFASSPIQNAYQRTVGAPAYAAPEAHCGLAGNRLLAPHTDVYAIGCMLFELFNRDYYFQAHQTCNRFAPVHLAAAMRQIDLKANEAEQRSAWNTVLRTLAPVFTSVKIDGPGSDIPAGIAPILNELLAGLTHIDYRERPTLSLVQRRLNSARAVLQNEREYQRRLLRVREIRRRKLENLRRREERLALAQANGRTLRC